MWKMQNNFLPLLERIWTCTFTLHSPSGMDTSHNNITSQNCSALVEQRTENASRVSWLASLGTRFCSCYSLYLFRERERVSSIPHFRRHCMAWGKSIPWGVGAPGLSCLQIDEESPMDVHRCWWKLEVFSCFLKGGCMWHDPNYLPCCSAMNLIFLFPLLF